MKDSIALMKIYRKYLEISEELIEILEHHCHKQETCSVSDNIKQKYDNFRTHVQSFIEAWNNDLHVLLRLDYELKEIEDIEKKEKR